MLPVILQVSNMQESINNRSFRYVQEKTTVIEYLLERLLSENDVKIVIATSELDVDDIYEDIAKQYKIDLIRGKYQDIIERLKRAGDVLKTDNMIRVFANYPLLDISEMRYLYQNHIERKADYSYNEHQDGILWGMGCEVFSKTILEDLSRRELSVPQQEALSFYIRQNESKFIVWKRVKNVQRPPYKVCLEFEKDLAVIREIIRNVSDISQRSVINYFEQHEVLARYNIEEPPREVGLNKMFLHTAKLSSIQTNEFDSAYPISVELTLTNVCNLKCVYCSDLDLRERQGMNKSFDSGTLKRLFSDLAKGGTKGVTLEGGGEPTLYPKFAEIVTCARQVGLAVGLITNGTVTLSSEILREFEWIRVSLDASNENEYKDLKGVDCFEKVMYNIGHYARHCETVGIGYVVTNQNVSQLEDLVMRLREMNVSYIQLRPVVDNEELYPSNVDLSYLRFYQNQKFGVIIDGMKENASVGNQGLSCTANGITSVISGDGSVYVCGRLNIYDWLKPIGNIIEQDFKDIWLGDERRKQCEMVRNKDFCKEYCPQCRISKFNQFFDGLKHIKSKDFI